MAGERAYDDIDAFGNPVPPSGLGATSDKDEAPRSAESDRLDAVNAADDEGRPSLEERARRRKKESEKPAAERVEREKDEGAPR